MATFNQELWQTVVYLFLSKFVKQANTPFSQKELINEKNVELAGRFVEMVGDDTAEDKIKFALLKAMRGIEADEMLVRISQDSLQLSDAGLAKMKLEIETAMMKIAQSFPDAKPQENPNPTAQ